MSKRDFVKERCDRAIEAFKNHELVDCREDQWRIAKRYPDGQLTSTHFAEIVSLWGGRLYVGGDIDDCVLAYFSDTQSHRDKLRWMGKCTDIGYYVRQKAQMGLTDNGKLVDEYDAQVAQSDLTYYFERELERIRENAVTDEESQDDQTTMRHIFEQASRMINGDPHDLRQYLYHELRALGDMDAWEWVGELGNIVSHRVV